MRTQRRRDGTISLGGVRFELPLRKILAVGAHDSYTCGPNVAVIRG